jgi:hypothetical protein
MTCLVHRGMLYMTGRPSKLEEVLRERIYIYRKLREGAANIFMYTWSLLRCYSSSLLSPPIETPHSLRWPWLHAQTLAQTLTLCVTHPSLLSCSTTPSYSAGALGSDHCTRIINAS